MDDQQHVDTLFLRLEGALQSWGERGKWTVRDTSMYPTKSGVIGLLGAALGVSDERLVDLSKELTMGIRVDRPGDILRDYHTVTSGVVMADGGVKGKDTPQTVVSHRFYLCGASFLVALRGSEGTIRLLANAVQNPQWLLCLGRSCCVPSLPVYAGVGAYDDLSSALFKPGEIHNYEIEGGSTLRMDSIVNVGARYFHPRMVTRLSA